MNLYLHQPTHPLPGVHGLEKDPEAEAARLNQGAEAREPAPEPLPELEMKLGSKDYEPDKPIEIPPGPVNQPVILSSLFFVCFFCRL